VMHEKPKTRADGRQGKGGRRAAWMTLCDSVGKHLIEPRRFKFAFVGDNRLGGEERGGAGSGVAKARYRGKTLGRKHTPHVLEVVAGGTGMLRGVSGWGGGKGKGIKTMRV